MVQKKQLKIRPKKPEKVDNNVRMEYNNNSNPACQKKEGKTTAGQNEKKKTTVSASLVQDRGTWTVRGRVYDPIACKMRQRAKSTGYAAPGNKRAAQQAMREIVKEWESEANNVGPKSDPLFSEYVKKFLAKKESSRRANTAKSYSDYARIHILPALGHLKVRQITLDTLNEYYRLKLETLSAKTLRKHHVVISGALLDAVRDKVISDNVAQYVELPAAKKFEGQSYTPEQVMTLLDAAEKAGEPIHTAVLLAAVYGMRRSEILGLRWRDIDFEAETITICHTLVRSGSLILDCDSTKTRSSRRTIDFVTGTKAHFAALKKSQEEKGWVLGKVIRLPDGRDVYPDYLTATTKKLMEQCGLPHIRFHDLRHTAGTLLATRCTPKQVQRFLGHSDISTTLGIYVHLLDEDRRATSEAMGEILKNPKVCSESCSETSDT